MKNNKIPENYNSPLIKRMRDKIDPTAKLQIETKMVLAAKLDDLIIAKGWSKKEFAEKMGKQPSEISKWLSGTHNFTIDTLVEIANALNVDVGELFVSEQKPAAIYPITLIPPTKFSGGMRQSFRTNTR